MTQALTLSRVDEVAIEIQATANRIERLKSDYDIEPDGAIENEIAWAEDWLDVLRNELRALEEAAPADDPRLLARWGFDPDDYGYDA